MMPPPVSLCGASNISLVVLIIAVIGLSVIFVNWYTALISVGVVSVIVGLSVQTPMTSFIGWIYILVRRPYRVGDRIKIGDATGDVIDVSYLDTTFGNSAVNISSERSSERPHHQVSELEGARLDGLQLFLAALPLHLERDQIPDRLRERSRVRRQDHAAHRRGRNRRGDDGASGNVFASCSPKRRWTNWKSGSIPRVIFRVNEETWFEAIVRYLVRRARPARSRPPHPQTARRPQRRTGKDEIPERRRALALLSPRSLAVAGFLWKWILPPAPGITCA